MIHTMQEPYSIVVLTGAGISKESGLDTFRDPDGVWNRVRVEDVATPQAFLRDPVRVHEFYNARRRRVLDPDVKPNAAHEALARLESEWSGDVLVVTQNVDDLHERAGSTNLIHMHGELLKARCSHCASVCDWRDDLSIETRCPSCGRGEGMRPDVVWFGEEPKSMEVIYEALGQAGLFLSIGTSGNVYPAASFVLAARDNGGCQTIEVNLEPSVGASLFDDKLYGPATVKVPDLVDRILATAAIAG